MPERKFIAVGMSAVLRLGKDFGIHPSSVAEITLTANIVGKEKIWKIDWMEVFESGFSTSYERVLVKTPHEVVLKKDCFVDVPGMNLGWCSLVVQLTEGTLLISFNCIKNTGVKLQAIYLESNGDLAPGAVMS